MEKKEYQKPVVEVTDFEVSENLANIDLSAITDVEEDIYFNNLG